MSLFEFRTVLSSPKIIKTRYQGSTAGFRTNMPLKNIYFYPETERNVSLKIKLSYGSRVYNYILVVVLVAVSTFTSELRETEKNPRRNIMIDSGKAERCNCLST